MQNTLELLFLVMHLNRNPFVYNRKDKKKQAYTVHSKQHKTPLNYGGTLTSENITGWKVIFRML